MHSNIYEANYILFRFTIMTDKRNFFVDYSSED